MTLLEVDKIGCKATDCRWFGPHFLSLGGCIPSDLLSGIFVRGCTQIFYTIMFVETGDLSRGYVQMDPDSACELPWRHAVMCFCSGAFLPWSDSEDKQKRAQICPCISRSPPLKNWNPGDGHWHEWLRGFSKNLAVGNKFCMSCTGAL